LSHGGGIINNTEKYLHCFWTSFNHKFGFGGGSGDSGDSGDICIYLELTYDIFCWTDDIRYFWNSLAALSSFAFLR
jgi:hypothetical protein